MSANPRQFSLLKHRPLLRFVTARAAATIAYQMMGVGVGWQVYDLTHKALDLGLVGLAQFLPSILLVLLVGHLADRHDRKMIVFTAQLVEAMALFGLAAFMTIYGVNRETIFIFLLVMGTARCFEFSTLQTLVPALVEPEHLPQAMAATSSVRQAATIAGPMLGGFLYMAGPITVYCVSAVLFMISAIMIALLPVRQTKAHREPASLKTVLAGITFIRSNPVVFGAISLDLFAVLLGGATALLPVFARDILFAGPTGLGILRASPALGALGASIYLARSPLAGNVGRTLFAAVSAFGVMTILFGLSRSLLLSCLVLAAMGWVDMISVVIRSSLVQLDTPDEMRGRVSAVNAVFIGTSNELGEFESGITAAWFGVVPAVLIGGFGTLAVVLIWTGLFPELKARQRLQKG
ncbi:MAG: MFS transporter [Geobacteraceae bacterium]|nr:MFS transporter [Geobacteraceae bacterium]